MTTAERLYEEAMQLPEGEREWLAERLATVVWGPPPLDDEEYWAAEIARRDAMPEKDDIPWEEVRAHLTAVIDKHAPADF
jgi:hypothetical protein